MDKSLSVFRVNFFFWVPSISSFSSLRGGTQVRSQHNASLEPRPKSTAESWRNKKPPHTDVTWIQDHWKKFGTSNPWWFRKIEKGTTRISEQIQAVYWFQVRVFTFCMCLGTLLRLWGDPCKVELGENIFRSDPVATPTHNERIKTRKGL